MPQSFADQAGRESIGLPPREPPPKTPRVPRSILVLLDADRRTNPGVISVAMTRARLTGAHVTMLCVWRRSRLLVLAPLANEDPDVLFRAHKRVVGEWFRARIDEVPANVALRTLLREGRAVDQIVRELRIRHYDELVLDRRLRRHEAARITRAAPEVNVIAL